MLVLTKAGLSLGKAITSSEVYNIVMQNKETSHLKGTVQMNTPKKNGITAKVEAHFLGPVHNKLAANLDSFAASHNKVFDDEEGRYIQIYYEVDIKLCDDVAKAQAVWKKVEEGPLALIKEQIKQKD